MEVTMLGEAHRTYMDPACGGSRAEHTKKCPRCGDEIPEENDATGEGPVYWKVTGEDFCSMECVIWTHRKWLKEQRRRHGQCTPPGTPEPDWEELWKKHMRK